MNTIKKEFSGDIQVYDGERAVVAKISTSAVDREGDVLVPQGCNSREFEMNPVVFLNHNYYELPVGKCAGIRRAEDCIYAKTVFAERPADLPAEQEWVPDTVLSLFKQGVIRGFSVGFQPIEYRKATPSDQAVYGEECTRVFSKWKMLEYSVAPLPANQEALAMAISKGLKTELFKEMQPEGPQKPADEPKEESEEEDEKSMCETCGEEIPDDMESCPRCGKACEKVVYYYQRGINSVIEQIAADAVAKRLGKIYVR